MNLTSEQLQAVQSGFPVHVADASGTDIVVVRADVFARLQAAADNALPAEEVARLIERNLQEYDTGDPLLDSYQRYRP